MSILKYQPALLIVLLINSACKEAKDLKEKIEEPEPTPVARLLPEPVDVSPTPVPTLEPTPTPQPTSSPVPTATPEPTPQATASPSPTPIAERCRDPEYFVMGSWQNVDRAEDVFTFNDDCTFTHETCGLYAQPWSVFGNNPDNTLGDLVMNPTGYNVAYPYCAQTGSGENLRTSCGWNKVSETRMLLNCHYFIGAQTYERVP